MKYLLACAAVMFAALGSRPLDAQISLNSAVPPSGITLQQAMAGFVSDTSSSHRSGRVEVGVFIQYTKFDENAGSPCHRPNNAMGPGGRVGVFVGNGFEVEADAVVASPELAVVGGDISYVSTALRLNYNLFGAPGSHGSLLGGVGVVRTKYEDDSHFGVSGIAGFRLAANRRLALRVDGVADYMTEEKNLNLGGRVGLSLFLGSIPDDGVASQPHQVRRDRK